MQTAGTITTNPQQREHASRRLWGGIILSLLGLQIGCCMFALVMATSSSSMAVIPDYHQRSLNWDQTQATLAASEKLGWQPSIFVDAAGVITVQLVDANDRPVVVDQMTISAYPHAEAGNLLKLPLQKSGEGLYRSAPAIHKPGIWQIELDAKKKQVRFAASEAYLVETSEGIR